MTRRIERNGGSTTFEYQRSAAVTVRIVDRIGAVTTEGRDALDRPVAITDPDGVTIRLEYDPDGQILASVDALGGRTTFEYDAAGRRRLRRTAVGVDSPSLTTEAAGWSAAVRRRGDDVHEDGGGSDHRRHRAG